MADRKTSILSARAYLSECRARRRSPVNRNFYWRLFAWAQASRRRAAAILPEPLQGGLFA